MKFKVFLAFASVGLLAVTASAANIVQNPGFESGTFSPWVNNPAASDAWTIPQTSPFRGISPNSGSFFAQTGCDSGANCLTPDSSASGNWLYQDLATNIGDTYTLTFFYAPGESGEGNVELQVLWGGTLSTLTASASGTCDTINTNCVFDTQSTTSGDSYVQYQVSDLTATSTSTRLEFLAEQDPDFNGLDDIDVEDTTGGSATPEPTTVLLVGGALLGLGLIRRRTLS